MGTFKYLDVDYTFTARYEKLICIRRHGFNGYNITKDSWTSRKVGAVVYDLMVMESGSLLYRLKKDGDEYYISMSEIYWFAFLTPETISKIEQVKLLQKEYRKIFDKMDDIERTYEGL